MLHRKVKQYCFTLNPRKRITVIHRLDLIIKIYKVSLRGSIYGTTRIYNGSRVQGAGASGSGAPATDASNFSLSAGGGAGAYAEAMIDASDISGSVTLIIGSGGLSTSGAGNAGGSTSFGSLLVCPGSAGPAAGSTVSSANSTMFSGAVESGMPSSNLGQESLLLVSYKGNASRPVIKSGGGILGVAGAASHFGTPAPGNGINSAPRSPTGYGADGSGAFVGMSGSMVPGSAGANGIIIVEEYF